MPRKFGKTAINLMHPWKAINCHSGAHGSSGLGVSIVPALCVEQMHELGARCIRLSSPLIERSIGIITRGEHDLSVAAQAISDLLVECSGLR